MSDDQGTPVRELSSSQRRVLGVLLEKAFTTPEYYPLTLKAVVTGCNQKSNREPVVNYDEDFVQDRLNELRELGLVGELHPDSGRSLRYRHYMRKRYEFSEAQLAILTELLLRGRQTLGELRGRASRMVPIDDLGTLRDELTGLIEQRYVLSNAALDRRGAEVDHGFYRSGEAPVMEQLAGDDDSDLPAPPRAVPQPNADSGGVSRIATAGPSGGDLARIDRDIAALRAENHELRSELDATRQQVADLVQRIEGLCRDLGV